jgi:hypothetical protein
LQGQARTTSAGPKRAGPKHRAAARRARAFFAGAAVTFVAFQAGLLLADWPFGLRDIDFGPAWTNFRSRSNRAPRGAPTVALLGTSRTQWGVRSRALEDELGGRAVVGNFGQCGADPGRLLLCWERLRRHGALPRLLLVEVLPTHYLGPGTEDLCHRTSLSPSRAYRHELRLLARYSRQRPSWEEYLPSLVVPTYSARVALLGRAAPALLPPEERPWHLSPGLADGGELRPGEVDTPLASPEARARSVQQARASYSTALAHYPGGFTVRPCAALEHLLHSCRREGVAVALVLFPEGPVFRSWYPPGALEGIREHFRALGARWGAPLIDARDWFDSEEAFYDSHHLLADSARRFSGRLAREVVAPLLRGQPLPGQTRAGLPLTRR